MLIQCWIFDISSLPIYGYNSFMNPDHTSITLPPRFADFYRGVLGPEADVQLGALVAGPAGKVARVIPSRFDFAGLMRLVGQLHLSLPTAPPRPEPRPIFDDAVLVDTALAGQLARSRAFEEGKFYLQSLPSHLVVKFLPVDEAAYALDVCASPGGKALHVYDRMGRGKPVLVNEPAGARRLRLVSVLKTYGAQELPLLGIDGGLLCQFVINEVPLIILDAPCSGEAHILHQPQRRREWTPRQTKMLGQRQLALAVAAVHALRPGGLMLYATCALSPFENELLIHELLARFPDALESQPWPVAKPADSIVPNADLSPLSVIGTTTVDPRIAMAAWRFRPTDFGEPFFAVLLKKNNPTAPKKSVEPHPIQYDRSRPHQKDRVVKVGPGRREFIVPRDWPDLPPLPYLHVGR